MKDEYLICPSCSGSWVLTIGDQQFFINRGLSLPRRCKGCRVMRRKLKEADYHEGHDWRDNHR